MSLWQSILESSVGPGAPAGWWRWALVSSIPQLALPGESTTDQHIDCCSDIALMGKTLVFCKDTFH